jgi:hypothetical protein
MTSARLSGRVAGGPAHPDVTAKLNAAVKYREPFRPFAPVVLAQHAGSFFRLAQPTRSRRSPSPSPIACRRGPSGCVSGQTAQGRWVSSVVVKRVRGGG